MPNHVTNRVTIVGKAVNVSKALLAIRGKEETSEHTGKKIKAPVIDFNTIIPMPEALSINPHFGIVGAVKKYCKAPLHEFPLLAALETKHRKAITYDFKGKEKELFEQGIENYRKYGFIYWYDWAIEKWGTKWNAYSSPDKRDYIDFSSLPDGTTTICFYFETAWSMPQPVIEALADKYHDLDITIEWADEDVGANSGRLHICVAKGIYDLTEFENESFEAYQIAVDLMPELRDELILSEDGKSYSWRPVDDDEDDETDDMGEPVKVPGLKNIAGLVKIEGPDKPRQIEDKTKNGDL